MCLKWRKFPSTYCSPSIPLSRGDHINSLYVFFQTIDTYIDTSQRNIVLVIWLGRSAYGNRNIFIIYSLLWRAAYDSSGPAA